jgi:hypothetical protein
MDPWISLHTRMQRWQRMHFSALRTIEKLESSSSNRLRSPSKSRSRTPIL